MTRMKWSLVPRRWAITGAAAVLALGSWAAISSAQGGATGTTTPQTSQGAASHQPQDQALAKQLEELRAQVARLQAELERQRQQPNPPASGAPTPGAAPAGSSMGQMGMRMGEMGQRMGMSEMGMSGGGEMSMMDMHKGEMGMPPEGMKMPDNMMEMGKGAMSGSSTPSSGMNMGGGASAGAATPQPGMRMSGGGASGMASSPRAPRSVSSLPGVPGASHLYHIGSTGFFLDQPQIKLTSEQQTTLNRIKERALLERTAAERKIEQAEQELWSLTGADQPDAAKVEAKLKEVEQLRTNQRMAFIRAVGEASNVLTADQRRIVLGTATPAK